MPGPSYVPSDAEDVRSHGATMGTGVSRSVAETNAQAIEEASADSASDSVYIPSGTLEFAGNFPIQFGDGYDGSAGASVYGDGPNKTFLKTNINHSNDEQPEVWYRDSGSAHGDIEWRGLTYDGNENLTDFSATAGRQRGFVFKDSGSCNSINFENFRIRHMVYGGFFFNSSFSDCDKTFDRISVYDIGIELLKESDGGAVEHAFGGGPLSSGVFSVTNSEFVLVAGSIIDTGSTNTGEFVNCYFEGIGDSICKSGNNLGTLRLRKIRHKASSQELRDANTGLSTQFNGRHIAQRQNVGSSDEIVELSNYYASGLRSTAFHAGDGLWDIRTHSNGGPIRIEDVSQTDRVYYNDWEAFHCNDGTMQFNVGDISVHNADDPIFGISGGGTISDLNRGSDTSLGTTDSLTISNDNVGGSAFSPTVPSQSEVGINSGTGATYTEDWSSYTVGNTPSGWTAQWNASASNYTVQDPSVSKSPVLEFSSSAEGIKGFSWDAVGTNSDYDMLGLVSFDDTDVYHDWVRLYVRGSGDSTSYTGYFATFMYDSSNDEYEFALRKYNDGDLSTLGQERIGASTNDEERWVRIRAQDTQIQAKTWVYGNAEPDSWNFDVQDSDISSGWAGVGSYTSDLQRWHDVSVGTGGETVSAPNPDLSVTTLDATNVTKNSADISVKLGSYDDGNNDAAVLFAEHRKQGDTSWNTTQKSLLKSVPYDTTHSISNLTSSTTYEYRASAEHCNIGISIKEATNVKETEAQLNLELTELSGLPDTEIYWQWREVGESSWNTTVSEVVSSTGEHSKVISGLSSGTDYEFRGVVDTETSPDSVIRVTTTKTFTTNQSVAVIDDFERTSLDHYSNDTGAFTPVDEANEAVSAISGTKMLKGTSGFSDIHSTSGLPNYFSKGEKAIVYVNNPNVATDGDDGTTWFGHSSSSTDGYEINHQNWGGANWRLLETTDGSRNSLDVLDAEMKDGVWYRMEITWDDGTLGGSDNDITVDVYNHDTSTKLGTLSGNDSTHSGNSGIGFTSQNGGSWFWDYYHKP